MKRYIYIIIGIIVAAAIVILVLFLIKNKSGGSSPGTAGTTPPGGSLPAAGTSTAPAGSSTSGALGLASSTASSASSTANGQMTVQAFGVLSADPVLDYFVGTNNVVTAIEPTGEVISVSGGQSNVINSSTIADIISASFSYDGTKILVSYGDSADLQAAVFDVPTDTWTVLPQGMQSPQWSPSAGYEIAYLTTTSNGELALATINAENPKASPAVLFTLNAQDLTLQWPTANEFVLADKPSYESDGSIWAFNSLTGTLTSLVYNMPGAEGLWSHDAAIPYGLVFLDGPSGQGSTLRLQAISNTGNLPTQTLSFLTLPSKCAFNPEVTPVAEASSTSSSTAATKGAAMSTPYLALYCGIPRDTSAFSSARLPDDYNMMALFTSDDIYKINTATGATQELWNDPTQNMDVSDMKFANDALFFVNRYDQKLYGLTFSQ